MSAPAIPVSRAVSPLAGRPVDSATLLNVPRLITAYYTGKPDPTVAAQRVVFGTSGHRGSAFDEAFNEDHILAISEAICRYRRMKGIDGPLFIGIDTHALSVPALATALEVFAAHQQTVMIDDHDGYTPTPVISHAILQYNRHRQHGLADGVIMTPSHNPPADGGFKYNPPHGGPAESAVTGWIEQTANRLLTEKLCGLSRVAYAQAITSGFVHRHDFVGTYVADLATVIDFPAIVESGLAIGIDPLGGASLPYWQAIIERYRLPATIVNEAIDPTFRFMTVDWDGKVRMDCSSPYAMTRLVGLRDKFDIAFANDTDADRHGIVTPSAGLMPPNHYLAAALSYLAANRPGWRQPWGVGKTMVSSGILDRVAHALNRRLVEVPVGFKWFVDGLIDGALGFAGEESAGASFLRQDGSVWTTDKDGLIAGLLAAEITAKTRHDPARLYASLTERWGRSWYERIDAPATALQRDRLTAVTPPQLAMTELAGEPVRASLTVAPGNGQPFGGIKVVAEHGWFAARPSGTEDIYKIYAESFRSVAHLRAIQGQAEAALATLFNA